MWYCGVVSRYHGREELVHMTAAMGYRRLPVFIVRWTYIHDKQVHRSQRHLWWRRRTSTNTQHIPSLIFFLVDL